MYSRKTLIFAVVIVGALMFVAGRVLWDGDSVDNPEATPSASPSVSGSSLPSQSPMVYSVRLTASGPVPKTLTIRAGDTVTLVGEDSAGFYPRSNTCSGFDALRSLTPGERYSLTFSERRTCTYYDNRQPAASSRQGTIIVL